MLQNCKNGLDEYKKQNFDLEKQKIYNIAEKIKKEVYNITFHYTSRESQSPVRFTKAHDFSIVENGCIVEDEIAKKVSDYSIDDNFRSFAAAETDLYNQLKRDQYSTISNCNPENITQKRCYSTCYSYSASYSKRMDSSSSKQSGRIAGEFLEQSLKPPIFAPYNRPQSEFERKSCPAVRGQQNPQKKMVKGNFLTITTYE